MDGDLDEARQRFQRAITARDVALAETVLHSGFALTLVQPVRATMSRVRWLAVLPDYIVHSYECEEEVVDVHGDLAAVLYRDRMVATVLGQDRSGTFVTQMCGCENPTDGGCGGATPLRWRRVGCPAPRECSLRPAQHQFVRQTGLSV